MRFPGSVAVATATFLAGATLVAGQHGQLGQHQDTRQPIQLPAMQRDMLLAEMRGLLTAVNGVLRGLAARDTALMRQSAASGGMTAMMRGEGMGMRRGAAGRGADSARMGEGRGMGASMPEGFRTLMHGTRSAFDSLALRIAAGVPSDTVIARLGSITSNCVACHASYRLEVRSP
ncbi:MAG TPA: hypothetical protein VLE53_17245 [Gemmatimonadaceae bacterium]|nr:hypothetical protein [Gemmatimonadaceae bacterium]